MPAWVTLGLLGAWALHDVEEVLAMRYWPARVPELRERFPQVPERLWREMAELDVRRFGLAVAGVGLVVGAAAAEDAARAAVRLSTSPSSTVSACTAWSIWPSPPSYAATPPASPPPRSWSSRSPWRPAPAYAAPDSCALPGPGTRRSAWGSPVW